MLRLITGLLILATLAGGVLYLQSDVFRTKAGQVYDEWTKWTPENITRDPEGYLTFAGTELEKIKLRLRAHQLHLTTKLDVAGKEQQALQARMDDDTVALNQLRSLYQASERRYPVSVNAQNYNEKGFQELVVELDQRVELNTERVSGKEREVAFYTRELERVVGELRNLEEKRVYVELRKAQVKTDLAVGMANDLTSKADEIAATARAIKSEQTAVKLDADNLVSTVTKERQAKSVKERFEQIMGSK